MDPTAVGALAEVPEKEDLERRERDRRSQDKCDC
jgi:hypothetical protein